MAALFQRWPRDGWRRVVLRAIGLGVLLWAVTSALHLFISRVAGIHHDLPAARVDLLAGLIVFVLLAVYFEVASYRHRSSEETLRKLSRAVEQSPSSVMITDLLGRIEYVNPKFTALTGYTLDEVRGRNPNILKSGETPDAEYATLWRTIKAGGEWRGEFHNVKKNGERYWELASISAIKDAAGRITHFLAVKEDITARKQAEAAEHQQRILVETLHDMAGAVNDLLDITDVLDAILTNLGRIVTHDAAYIMLIEDGVARVVRCRKYSPDAEATILALRQPVNEAPLLSQIVTDQQPVIRVLEADRIGIWGGHPALAWVGMQILAPIRARGQVIGILGVDVQRAPEASGEDAWRLGAVADQVATAIQNARAYDAMRDYAIEREQQAIERLAELERERAKLRVMFDAMGEGVAYIEDGRVQYVNRAFAGLLGYDDQEVIDQQLTLFKLAANDADRDRVLRSQIEGALEHQRPWRGELRLRRKDGSVFDAAVTTSQVLTPFDSLPGRVTIVRDISGEKALQAQKDRFMTHASHELRTPISNLKMRLYLLRRQPERVEEHLSVLDTVVDHMAALVEDLLDVIRLGRRALPIKREPLLVRDVLHDVVATQRARSEQNGVAIVTALSDEAWSICADRRWLTRGLANLVAVAIEDSPPGSTVTISAHGDGAGHVELAVQGGYGIIEGDLTQVFEPFFRPSEGGNDSVSLGLAIAKEIVELHDGTITLASSPGEGGCFLVSLDVAGGCDSVEEMSELSGVVESGPHD